MNEFTYTPDESIEIHRQNAIRHMCAPFLSHEAGLPEWIKNSAAAYIKEDVLPAERVIVVAFRQSRRGMPGSISCLDFVGMTSEQIEYVASAIKEFFG